MSSSCVKLCGSDALADALKGLHSALGYVSIRRRKSGTSLDCRIREFKMTVVRSHREDPNLASGPHILYNVCLHECLSIKLALASQAALWVLFSRRRLRAMGTRRMLPGECWSCCEEGGEPGPVVGARHSHMECGQRWAAARRAESPAALSGVGGAGRAAL